MRFLRFPLRVCVAAALILCEATGMMMSSSDGSAEDKGFKHKLGIYVFSKDSGDKAFVLSTWTPEAALTDNAEGIFKMLGSIKLH